MATIGDLAKMKGAQLRDTDFMNFDSSIDYLKSGSTINEFWTFLRSSIDRYKYNDAIRVDCENDQEDLLHEAELTPAKNAYDGYRIYEKIREVRQERRRCKDENDILEPIVEYLNKNPQFMAELDKLQKICNTRNNQMARRRYQIRGTALREMGFRKLEIV